MPEAALGGRRQHGPALVGVERADFAEGVDPSARRRHGVEHLAAHQVDVVVGAPVELGRHDVRAEERGLGGDGPGDVEQPTFVDGVVSP